ncbi:MAG: bifunctional DNA-formamidopyrimidine glycosylase/DNA-(apurinic or apyrimidinic site) lyase [bacterium]|nr:bifunctional DNA-formamidopyrimidine glycosylase/DNA-(apurinic or apyrimidinic site) lyase [bacterium]
MPELPEVETVARQLNPAMRGMKLKRVEVRDAKLHGPEWDSAKGYSIAKVRRVSKRVVFDLTHARQKPLWVAVHLRMTGRLVWVRKGGSMAGTGPRLAPNEDGRAPPPPDLSKSLRLIFHLDGGELRFNDTRRFGTVELLNEEPTLIGAALEPLSRSFTSKALGKLLDGARGEIKPWLMRQDRIAGMGNIYASEALFLAGIDPRRSSGSLSMDEASVLRKCIADVMRRAVAKAGTTFSDYADSRGKSGSFQNFLQVYSRAGKPCRACGEPVQQITQQQRSTFFCTKCQH